MSKKILDCRGLACPQPVIQTKKELERQEVLEVEVLVDNTTARENLLKLGRSMDIPVQGTEKDGYYVLSFQKGAHQPMVKNDSLPQEAPSESTEVVLITSEFLGKGDDALGKILMKGFLYTLSETTPALRAVLFLNSGVKLTTENEETVAHLVKMEQQGVKMLSCGTCLDFYHLKDRLKVGEVANMYDIVDMLRSTTNKWIV